MVYRVWNPDDEGEEDGEEIVADSPDSAAQIYLSGIWNSGYSDSVDVFVKDEEDNIYEVTVDIELEPNFYAYSRKVK
jgi:hypothetical protein